MMNKKKPIFQYKRLSFFGLLVAVIMLVGVVSGCKSDEGSKFNNATGMQKEYRAAADKLTLPPGFVFPANFNTGGAGNFQQGVGVQNAQRYWIIAWENEWLEQRNKDEARARKALDVLTNEVPKSWSMTKGSDETVRRFFSEYLKKAELGDPSGFQRDVELNGLKMQRSSK